MLFPFNRGDFLKVLDHFLTRGRHWRAGELQQFDRKGPVVKVGARSFQIHYETSGDPEKMFPQPGLNGHLLVEEQLGSRSWNSFLNRGAATDVCFRAAVDAHLANQTGWLKTVEAELVAEDVKSVVEHTDIYRVFNVWVPGPGMPSTNNHRE